MIYEIRNYHVEPSVIDRYAEWASTLALPYIRRHLDLVDFWISTDIPSQVTGRPLDELGSANITWIIRWEDLSTRTRVMSAVFGPDSEDWSAISTQHPGRQHYLRIEAKFATAL